MWSTIMVDIIAIAASIAIILMITDDSADRGSQHAADGRTGSGPESWNNRAGESAGPGADYGPGCATRNHMISVRVTCAAAKRQTGYGSG